VAGDLAVQVGELRQRLESHREAEATLRRTEREALDQLLATVTIPAAGRDEMFGTYGWSRVPAPLKLVGLTQRDAPLPSARARPLTRLRSALRPRGETRPSRSALLAGQGDRIPAVPAWQYRCLPVATEAACGTALTDATGSPDWLDPLAAIGDGETVHPPAQLAVHLLGPLCVAVDDVAAEDWPSARCRSLFGYLLTHREPWPPREVLMEVFWPGSSPEASRNSLNVAIHGLRRTLRNITDVPVVVHAGGAYRINRDLRLWLDIDEFDSRVESGRRFEAEEETDKAMREYEFADGLYRGDFLADDPYEDWAALARERLRLAYLEALGRLSNLYFNAARYAACAALCQRIIEKDPCREDAHRRLMRCYSRQGQPHLALMQYRACARALAEELGVETDPSTMELHQHIRRHERV
jgi:DNA-binding SARP family transcriptional activator